MSTSSAALRPTFFLAEARHRLHTALLKQVLFSADSGIPSNAAMDNKVSVTLAMGILAKLEAETPAARVRGRISGGSFGSITCDFLSETLPKIEHFSRENWTIRQTHGRDSTVIAPFEQYAHLVALYKAAATNPELAAALGSDYTITPDIVVVRALESDDRINEGHVLVDKDVSRLASLRKINGGQPLLHASISCKWTIRSDRVQNARSEALNLIRNRKGRLPHVMVVTGEPLPSRLSAIALGTGDIDCVYHFALPELVASVEELIPANGDTLESLRIMVEGKRLKDISDLPLDLAV